LLWRIQDATEQTTPIIPAAKPNRSIGEDINTWKAEKKSKILRIVKEGGPNFIVAELRILKAVRLIRLNPMSGGSCRYMACHLSQFGIGKRDSEKA
jgi:hypothetical protein